MNAKEDMTSNGITLQDLLLDILKLFEAYYNYNRNIKLDYKLNFVFIDDRSAIFIKDYLEKPEHFEKCLGEVIDTPPSYKRKIYLCYLEKDHIQELENLYDYIQMIW